MKPLTAAFGNFVTAIVSAGFVVTAVVMVAEASSMHTARMVTLETDTEVVDAYRVEQAALLSGTGFADDRTLGGQPGETKRSQKLGLKSKPIAQAKSDVTAALKAGTWKAKGLTAEQTAALEAMSTGGLTEEMLVTAAASADVVAQGKADFGVNCVACHGPTANGLVGPNLTDDYVIHGRGPMEIYKFINKGNASKGMPPWGHLGQEKITGLTAYMLALIGTNVSGKAPEGIDAAGKAP